MDTNSHKQPVERLEQRVQLAASFASVNANGTLSVVGNSNGNTIEVSITGSKVLATRDGQTLQFNKSKVKRVWMHGFGGDDVMTNLTNLSSTVIGGAGSDTLTGGSNNDVFEFEPNEGDNTVRGGGGSDTLDYSNSIARTFVLFDGSINTHGNGIDIYDRCLLDSTVFTLSTTSRDDNVTVYGWGDDPLIVTTGNGNDFVAASNHSVINTGEGNDTVHFNEDGVPDKIILGSGNDVIYDAFGGTHLQPMVDAGRGHDIRIIEPDIVYRDLPVASYVLSPGLEDFAASYGNTTELEIIGNELNNRIVALAGRLILHGADGDDTLEAIVPAFSDPEGFFPGATLLGGAGYDILRPSGGSYYIPNEFSLPGELNTGKPGVTYFSGGEGISVLDYSRSDQTSFNFSHRRIRTSAGEDHLDPAMSKVRFLGTDKADKLAIGDLDLTGEWTWDSGNGDDFVSFAEGVRGVNRIVAGEGNDTVLGSEAGPSSVDLGAGDDDFIDYGGPAQPQMNGGSRYDRYLKTGNQAYSNLPYVKYILGPGIELFSASEGFTEVLVVGNELNNQIYISGERVTVKGGAGDDDIRVALIGEEPNNAYAVGASLYGEAGNDTLVASGVDIPAPHNLSEEENVQRGISGLTKLVGGSGNDTADYSSFSGDLFLSLDNQANDGYGGDHDNIGADIETILGGSGNDTIIGNPFNNRLLGNGGNDTLWGGAGNDTLIGGAGADSLFGQEGNDTEVQ